MSSDRPATLRCAIYTRKSHEEGLEQAFNSLDAQREAGVDYIKSQKHQGWQLIDKHYDDGGYSGGTIERPGLKALLTDISQGRVDAVVVYKVDRLSRSLHDFAQMMQTFDAHQVSFVSVTQQFNTTTSMGRLTLNMLLSFAQFEREVTGERIRDKIAATKKKGLWICGQPPLGYRLERDGKLVIVPEEAKLVRKVFQGYMKEQSLVKLAEELNRQGHTTKRWQSVSSGQWRGGKPLTTALIHRLLRNPIYIGKIRHTRGAKRGDASIFPGQHEAIIDRKIWDQVHGLIEKQEKCTRHRWSHPQFLKGKLRTEEGFAMTPGSVQRPAAKGKRPCDPGETTLTGKRLVRYYVSLKAIKRGFASCPIKTINAQHLDDLVRGLVMDQLRAMPHNLTKLDHAEPQLRDHWLRKIIDSVVLSTEQVTIKLDEAQICACAAQECGSDDLAASNGGGLVKRTKRPAKGKRRGDEGSVATRSVPTCPYTPHVERDGRHVVLTLLIQIKRVDGKRVLLSPDGHELVHTPASPEAQAQMVHDIGLAFYWQERLLTTGISIRQLARECGTSPNRIRRLLPLTQLEPGELRRALRGE